MLSIRSCFRVFSCLIAVVPDAGATRSAGIAISDGNALMRSLVPKQVRDVFQRLYCSWMICTFTPARRLEHPDLRAALAHIGVAPPTRRQFSDHLDALYDATRQSILSLLAAATYVCITMDGWKSRTAEQGAPLVTVNLLLPDGTSIFWKVCVTVIVVISLYCCSMLSRTR